MLSKPVRITFLLLVLAFVAADNWLTHQRTTSWEHPLWAVIYPINGDGSEIARQHIASLTPQAFRSIETFFSEESANYGLQLQQPIMMQLAPQVDALPPSPPHDGNVLKIMAWSLELRWWAWRHDTFNGPGNLKVFVIYHAPQEGEVLPHSLGLEKGLIGVAHVFADPNQDKTNNVIIAHEMLHLFGATDKYDPATDQPIYPEGYAEPEKQPRLPQRFAEIMGGRIPLSDHEAEIPPDLDHVLIGKQTAREINWTK